jgi:flagellar motor switch protein FliN/FliY
MSANDSTENYQPTPEEAAMIADAEFGLLAATEAPPPAADAEQRRNLEALYAVPLVVSAHLGETQMTIRDLLVMKPGAVIELDRTAGDSIDLYVNGVRVGSGDAVVVNDNYGLRITELLSPAERLANL